jgi:hypothetical protein
LFVLSFSDGSVSAMPEKCKTITEAMLVQLPAIPSSLFVAGESIVMLCETGELLKCDITKDGTVVSFSRSALLKISSFAAFISVDLTFFV